METGLAILLLILVVYASVARLLANRQITMPIVLVVVGLLIGPRVLNLVPFSPDAEFEKLLTEITLALLLFGDRDAKVSVEIAPERGRPGKRPPEPALVRLQLRERPARYRRQHDVVVREVHGEAIEPIGDRGGALDPLGMIDRILVGAELDRLVGQFARLRLGPFIALEQRVALQLGLDERVEFEMAELQQLDRLHQLRSERQALRLPHLHTWPQCHSERLP